MLGLSLPDAVLDHAEFSGCTCRFLSLSAAKLKAVRFAGCDCSDGSFQECTLKSVQFGGCNLSRSDFLHTPLKGINLTDDEIGGIVLSGPELRGAVVTMMQACDLSRYLGLVIQ